MRDRCRPGYKGARYYYERGIRVSPAFDTFEAFLAHVGYRPEGTSIDRIDNNGNYEPGNVRWATKRTQMLNRSDNKLLTAFGKTMTLTEWSIDRRIPIGVLWARVHAGNWTIENCLDTPIMTAKEASALGHERRWIKRRHREKPV